MATLHLINTTTGEEYEVPDIDFSQVTPKDILESEDLGLPAPLYGHSWAFSTLKDRQILDSYKTLEKLGFQDGDTAYFRQSVLG